VSGFNFSPGTSLTIDFIQGTTTHLAQGVPVMSNGKFLQQITIPALALPVSATIKATGASGVGFTVIVKLAC
jgi:ABC-type polysaccharide/polyol phosphate export permease